VIASELAAPPPDLRAWQDELDQALRRAHVTFLGDRTLPVSLSPYIIESGKYRRLARLGENLLSAIERLVGLYVEQPELRALFPELERFGALALRRPSMDRFVHVARFDLVETADGEFRIMETNCDCPGAILYLSAIAAAVRQHSAYPWLAPRAALAPPPLEDPDFFVRSFVAAHGARGGAAPSIGFLNSRYRTLTTDLNLLEASAHRLGLRARQVPVQALQLWRGRVGWDDADLDLAYQKFDAFIDDDGQARPCIYEHSRDEVAAYWHGLETEQFAYANSFPSALVAENKRILWLLGDPDLRSLFAADEREAIDALCPETFPVDRGRAETLVQRREDYVLKRVIDTRGRGVVIGRHSTADQWAAAVADAVRRPTVAQRYIPHPPRAVLGVADSTPTPMFQNLGLFLIAGRASGLICRASTDPITNIARHGAMQPVFIVESERGRRAR
jgi:hypothetical protein